MKERPIMFSSPMVRAILEGRKTQTRRVVRQPRRKDGAKLLPDLLQKIGVGHACPYGVPGDRLWVRETLKRGWMPHLLTGEPTGADRAEYAADGEPVLLELDFDAAWQWQRPTLPAIHMPRWASRLTLEVLSVRVERLQAISEEDALAEGLDDCPACDSARDEFRAVWDSINADRAPWASNPWVWVVEFRRLGAKEMAA